MVTVSQTFSMDFLECKCMSLIKISLKFVPKDLPNNFPALAQVMAWRRSGEKPLSESMMVKQPTHICVTEPQWVNTHYMGLRRESKSTVTWGIALNFLTHCCISSLWIFFSYDIIWYVSVLMSRFLQNMSRPKCNSRLFAYIYGIFK